MTEEGMSEPEIALIRKELDQLFKLRQEIAEKITGRNLTKEAEEKVKGEVSTKE